LTTQKRHDTAKIIEFLSFHLFLGTGHALGYEMRKKFEEEANPYDPQLEWLPG
jgi:hypothetical protein